MGEPSCLTPRQHCRPCGDKRKPLPQTEAAAISRFPAFRKIGGLVKAAFGWKSSLKGIFLAAVVLAAGNALAASRGSLELQHPTTVGGKQLATGNYTVQWDGTGDQVELKVYKGKNVVASTSARVVKVEHPAHNAAITIANGDGTSSLSEILFGGKDFALQLSNEGGGSGASGAAR
jgi:hypothetical protein